MLVYTVHDCVFYHFRPTLIAICNYGFVAVACRPAAELASFWNKPLVTWVATDPEFNDKTVYTTMGRTLGPFNKMGTFLVEVFQQYNWRKVVVISSNFFLWLDAGKAIRKVKYRTYRSTYCAFHAASSHRILVAATIVHIITT